MIKRHEATRAALLTACILLASTGLTGCDPPATSISSQYSETTPSVTTSGSEKITVTPVHTETPAISPTSQPSVSPTAASPAKTPTVTPKPVPSSIDSYVFLNTEQAAALALDHVGDAARILSIEAEFDDNPPIYEMKLTDGTYNYEIEIHAITGTILDYERTRAEDESDDEPDDDDIDD